MAAPNVIEIPLNNKEAVLEVDLSDLQENAEHILSILKQEKVPVALFAEFADEYHQRSMFDHFKTFLNEGLAAAKSARNQDPQHLLLLNSLASFNLNEARKCKLNTEQSERERFINAAVQYYNEADRIDSRDPLSAVGKGVLQMLRGELVNAMQAFMNATKMDPNCIPALIGLAAAQARKGEIKMALSFYQKVLTLVPNLKPDVRLAIGICYHQLGMSDHARRAFVRVLQRDNRNADACALLAVMDWNASRKPGLTDPVRKEHSESFAKYLKMGIEINHQHPLIALMMAQRFMSRDLKKALVYAKIAVKYSTSQRLLADSLTTEGRAYQALGKYAEAFESFKKAAALNPRSLKCQYALGEMYIYHGDIEKAIECFEAVRKGEPDDHGTIRRLASLYAQKPDSKKQASECFEKLKKLLKMDREAVLKEMGVKSVELKEDDYLVDPDIHIEMGRLAEGTDIKAALVAYDKAVQLIEKGGDTVEPELLNNIGSLLVLEASSERVAADERQQQALLAKARGMFLRVRDICTQRLGEPQDASNEALADEVVQRTKRVSVTCRYNLGRCYEREGSLDKARELYEDVLKDHPNYVDCYLRLAALQIRLHNFAEAEDYIKDVFTIDPKNIDAWLMLGALQQEPREGTVAQSSAHRRARDTYEKILKEIDSHDTYSLCCVGNLNLWFAKRDAANKEQHHRRAYEFFDKALQWDNQNAYAATGVGITLAVQGHLSEARDVFTQVQETTHNNQSAILNLAHVMLESNQTGSAIALYESLAKKTNYQDPYILQCLARGHYVLAKTLKVVACVEHIQKAVKYLEKALRLTPSNLTLLYNLAIAKHQIASILNDLPAEERDVGLMQKAVDGLPVCKRLLTFLGTFKEGTTEYSCKHATSRAVHCDAIAKTALKRMHETGTLTKVKQERLRAIEEERRQLEENRKKQERERAELEDRRRQQIEVIVRQLQDKTKENTEKQIRQEENERETQSQKEGARRGKSRKSEKSKDKDGFIQDDDGEDNSDYFGDDNDADGASGSEKHSRKRRERDGDKHESRKKKRISKKLSRKTHDSSDEDAGDNSGDAGIQRSSDAHHRTSHRKRNSSDEDDEDEDVGRRKRPSKYNSSLSKANIDSDDEEDDDDNDDGLDSNPPSQDVSRSMQTLNGDDDDYDMAVDDKPRPEHDSALSSPQSDDSEA
ncbi:uncharacterized protein BJ171DRAFT_564374 [Polychytrium aggregatum]|uniref:uncharacterized protein n=1 Tax=Polychytrium aggregatum TaxID=110093 RepID=UPI0022FE7C1F|nr:uncharacterized protein BJ171DRAFT_564374 [Polychytrium aggregatum]KAI9209886.1 hypothetical protein BJ171DRAFT_564374 [Polychytrium aggregatum]